MVFFVFSYFRVFVIDYFFPIKITRDDTTAQLEYSTYSRILYLSAFALITDGYDIPIHDNRNFSIAL